MLEKNPIVVAMDGTGDYTNLADAVANAADRTTIIVKPGEYKGPVRVDKQIEITGENGPSGYPTLWADSRTANTCLKVTAPAVIENLQVTFRGQVDRNFLMGPGEEFYAAVTMENSAVLTNVSIYNWPGTGLCVKSNAAPIIENCDIFENNGPNVDIRDGESTVLRGCKIHNCNDVGIYAEGESSGTLENSEIFGNTPQNIHVAGENTKLTIRTSKIHDSKDNEVFVERGASCTIESCDVFGSDEANLHVFGENTSLTVRKSNIHNSQKEGILIGPKGQCTIEDSDIHDNAYSNVKTYDNIWFKTYASLTIRGGKIHASKRCGIEAGADVDCEIENCDIYENKQGNLSLNDCKKINIHGCKIHDTGSNNIDIDNIRGTIDDCEIFNTAEYSGIVVKHSGMDFVIQNCKIYNNCYGLVLADGTRSVVDSCDLFKNNWSNIDIVGEGSNPTIFKCEVHDCGLKSIFIHDKANGTIEYCKIYGKTGYHVRIEDEGTNPTISNCDIHGGAESTGVSAGSKAGGSIEDCVITGNGGKPDCLGCNIEFEDEENPLVILRNVKS